MVRQMAFKLPLSPATLAAACKDRADLVDAIHDGDPIFYRGL